MAIAQCPGHGVDIQVQSRTYAGIYCFGCGVAYAAQHLAVHAQHYGERRLFGGEVHGRVVDECRETAFPSLLQRIGGHAHVGSDLLFALVAHLQGALHLLVQKMGIHLFYILKYAGCGLLGHVDIDSLFLGDSFLLDGCGECAVEKIAHQLLARERQHRHAEAECLVAVGIDRGLEYHAEMLYEQAQEAVQEARECLC